MAVRNPISRADFALRVQGALKAEGLPEPFEWDELENRLTRPNGAPFLLEAHFLEAQDQPAAHLDQLLRAYARMYLNPPRQPAIWAEAKEKVFPWIRPMSYHASRAFQGMTGETVESVPYGTLTPHVTVCAATVSDVQMMGVTMPDLERWGLSFEAVLAQGQTNVERRGTPAWQSSPEFPGMFRSPWKDEFGIARLIFRDIYKRLALRGDPVVIAPTWQTFFVAGSDDVQGLESLAKFAVPMAQKETFLILRPMRLRGDQVDHWLPPEGHPAREPLHMLHLLNEVGDYATQAQTGRRFFERQETPSNIPVPVICVVRGVPGFQTLATWREGPPCALPEASYVLLKRRYETVGFVSFASLRKVLGSELQPMNLYPQRWLGRRFPHEGQLAGMDLVPWDPSMPPL